MRSKRVILVGCLVCLLLYLTSYFVWSRCFAWGGGRLWSFSQPPAGLIGLDVAARYRLFGDTAWEGWERVESIPGTFFSPCILVDQWLTGRTYLPSYQGAVCFN